MSAASASGLSGVHFKPQFFHHCNSSTPPTSITLHPLHASSPKLQFLSLRPQRLTVSCNSGTPPGGSSSGDNESRNVLDAFFLGKALGEALSERVESTIGEFLSTVGSLQAEQQKQVQDFQDDVFERARKAKEKAAREASPTSSSYLTENNSPSASATEDTNGKFDPDPSLSISIED